jgi:demethylmenaquinone methyltransferase/2-methoxy-6-polyprenyl-1,4-benzoquinol methylase
MDHQDKPEYVRELFASIASRYELVNHLLSGGLDFYWRAAAMRHVKPWKPALLLDVATGSGDLALAIQQGSPGTRVVGADFCRQMLEVAQRKGMTELVEADGLHLPFANDSFDAVTVAFGLRNMASWEQGLTEMARVLKLGGHLLILDFSIPTLPLIQPLYRAYLHRVLPTMAGLVTGRKDAYEYLGGSIEQFPSGPAMIQMMELCGFQHAKSYPLSLGTVSLYTAELAPAV